MKRLEELLVTCHFYWSLLNDFPLCRSRKASNRFATLLVLYWRAFAAKTTLHILARFVPLDVVSVGIDGLDP